MRDKIVYLNAQLLGLYFDRFFFPTILGKTIYQYFPLPIIHSKDFVWLFMYHVGLNPHPIDMCDRWKNSGSVGISREGGSLAGTSCRSSIDLQKELGTSFNYWVCSRRMSGNLKTTSICQIKVPSTFSKIVCFTVNM